MLVAIFFFFNDTATTEIYTLSLHDALPIWRQLGQSGDRFKHQLVGCRRLHGHRRLLPAQDRKSTRLNSSHANISYAVFCLKKKKNVDFRGAEELRMFEVLIVVNTANYARRG